MLPPPPIVGLGGLNGGQVRSMDQDLRRLFLELAPEENRQNRASQLLQQSSESEAVACISLVLDRLVNFSTSHGLGIHALRTLLHVHPLVMVQILTPQRIYDLFNPNVDDGPAAEFLHAYVCFKEQQGQPVNQETTKLQRLLMRRSKQHDLRRVQRSLARAWLCQIWLDAPSSRPERQVLAACCVCWIADAAAPIGEKLPCLALMAQEFQLRGRPDAETWLISMLLEQVCRDPVGHSPDLQHLLWPLGGALNSTMLQPLFQRLAHEPGRLAALWVCLSLWAPQAQPQGPVLHPWPPNAPAPIHVLLCSVFNVFLELEGASALCCTSLLSVAAMAASGEGAIAAAAVELLFVLHRDCHTLPAEAWIPLMPLLEGFLVRQFPMAVELVARLRQTTSGSGMAPIRTGLPLGPGVGANIAGAGRSPMPQWSQV